MESFTITAKGRRYHSKLLSMSGEEMTINESDDEWILGTIKHQIILRPISLRELQQVELREQQHQTVKSTDDSPNEPNAFVDQQDIKRTLGRLFEAEMIEVAR